MRQDLEWYITLAELGFFNTEDLKYIFPSQENEVLQECIDRGYVEHVHQNWYITLNIDTKYPLVDRFWIATRMFPDSCICLHSAFEIYGLGNQGYFEVYVNSPKSFNNFTYFNISFTHIPIETPRKITIIHDISLTSIEQTIVDSIADLEKHSDTEEVLRCLEHLPNFSEEKLLQELDTHNDAYLWQKTGFIFEFFAEEYAISNDFFEICKSHIKPSEHTFNKRSMYPLRYNTTWQFYTPESLDVFLYEPFYNVEI